VLELVESALERMRTATTASVSRVKSNSKDPLERHPYTPYCVKCPVRRMPREWRIGEPPGVSGGAVASLKATDHPLPVLIPRSRYVVFSASRLGVALDLLTKHWVFQGRMPGQIRSGFGSPALESRRLWNHGACSMGAGFGRASRCCPWWQSGHFRWLFVSVRREMGC